MTKMIHSMTTLNVPSASINLENLVVDNAQIFLGFSEDYESHLQLVA